MALARRQLGSRYLVIARHRRWHAVIAMGIAIVPPGLALISPTITAVSFIAGIITRDDASQADKSSASILNMTMRHLSLADVEMKRQAYGGSE